MGRIVTSGVEAAVAVGSTDRRLLLLAPEDNVLVACGDLPAGTELVIDGEPVRLAREVPTGHKLARRAIAAGEKVVKYGAPIGSAREPIAKGAYVHTHNLRSDYIPTWDRTGAEMR
ncbi:MAG: UxaA family hydrolase [Geminicoccaceae bacterium]|nr:UxaA family hydrolase [Geminicoccaceae bacterium]